MSKTLAAICLRGKGRENHPGKWFFEKLFDASQIRIIAQDLGVLEFDYVVPLSFSSNGTGIMSNTFRTNKL